METSLLICRASQWTGFYMITASVMKELTGSDKIGGGAIKELKIINF